VVLACTLINAAFLEQQTCRLTFVIALGEFPVTGDS